MSDSEKLTALKKAYADMILNTAKEAAARIMVSERKAIRYQQELVAARDEALRMMLRLKQMMDTKVNEAQVASLYQQRKIEELEAQLGEAEDIVKDLRTELRETQDELEKVEKNQRRLVEQNSNLKATDVIPASPEIEPNSHTQNPNGNVANDVEVDSSEIADVRNSALTSINEGKECYNENGTHKENCCFCNSDFASIVMRRKEPKLYRNGCTQRIRALERNLFGARLRNGNSTEENKEDVYKNADSSGGEGAEENPNESKTALADGNCLSVNAVKSFRKRRNRDNRYKRRKALSFGDFPDTAMGPTEEPNAQLEEILETKSENDLESSSALKLPSEVSRSDIELSKAETNKLVVDSALGETRLESGYSKSFKYLEPVNESLVNKDGKASDVAGGAPSRPSNDRFLKYTFQRKRKRESFSSPDRDSIGEGSVTKRKIGEKHNVPLGSENSSSMTQSLPDSCQLAEAAQQLVSLRTSGSSSSLRAEGNTRTHILSGSGNDVQSKNGDEEARKPVDV